jgi:hypothetical protein
MTNRMFIGSLVLTMLVLLLGACQPKPVGTEALAGIPLIIVIILNGLPFQAGSHSTLNAGNRVLQSKHLLQYYCTFLAVLSIILVMVAL